MNTTFHQRYMCALLLGMPAQDPFNGNIDRTYFLFFSVVKENMNKIQNPVELFMKYECERIRVPLRAGLAPLTFSFSLPS